MFLEKQPAICQVEEKSIEEERLVQKELYITSTHIISLNKKRFSEKIKAPLEEFLSWLKRSLILRVNALPNIEVFIIFENICI